VVLTAPVVLDGGLATELEARGHDLSDSLWSARLLMTDPHVIEEVHLAYFRAGAHVATTANYQASVPGFERAGLDRPAALSAIERSVRVATRARDRYAGEAGVDLATLRVAGSVGPYGAMLADGSEYRGDYDPGTAALRDFHGPRIDALTETGVDLLAIETIPTTREAAVLVELVRESGSRAWLSFQCRDGSATAAGEPIEEAVALASDVPGIVAVGVNCTAPHLVPELLERAASVTDRPLVAYPNSGDRWNAATRAWEPSVSGRGFDPNVVATWTAIGACWLGGCCGTGPADIAALRDALAP
jgi:homocysteine S-methyltransferase